MEDWIHVNPSQGTGGGTVQVTLDPNESEEDREGNLIIQTLTKQTIVKLIQKGVSMYYYVIRTNDTDYFDLYKINPSTEEETLLSTTQEYTQAKEDILSLKALVLLQQNSSDLIFPDKVFSSMNAGSYNNALVCLYNYYVGTRFSNLANVQVIFGSTWNGSNIYKFLNNSRKIETSYDKYLLNITGSGTIENGTLVDYQPDSSHISIYNKNGEVPDFPLLLFSSLDLSPGGNIAPIFQINLKLTASFHTDLSESPFTTLTLVTPLTISYRVAYNGANNQIIGEGLLMSNIFSSPLKIKIEFMKDSIYPSKIGTLEGTKVNISPLISTTPAQTE